ncbi:MAG: YitT family protein [Eubacteriales bacterium]|nr:YitT family protein [Eubacteriales bacterium]MDD3199699.1 YitT family protein [Eubacteriales bacterium]MDD4122391.1 YitT family protein [Eubacteriales bacterium]MDD4629101.1 YitT family protein [Eubacteriales bacterium]
MKSSKITKADLKKFAIDMLFILAGCSISAVSTIGILIPNGLTSGGITGIVRMIQGFFDVSFSLVYYAFAMLILIVCAILLGLREARKILLMSILYPAILFIFEHINFSLLEEKDLFLAAIYCGVLGGICTGLVFVRGYSSGGTDTIAKMIQQKLMPHISLSQILLVIDASIIIGSGFLFGRNIALYALVTQVIFSKTVDYVMYGFDTKAVQLEIITSKHDDVSNYILNDLRRGVTNVTVTGAYTKIARQKIVTICSPREGILIKKFVAKTDKNAFVTVIHVDNVWGNGEGFGDILKE